MRAMGTVGLRRAMSDIARWTEGDGELHERLAPGGLACPGAGPDAFADGFRIGDVAGGSYGVAVARRDGVPVIATSRTWFEGMDAWEAAGRPSDPSLMPRHAGVWLSCVAEPDWLDVHRDFARAALALHAVLGGRYDAASREAAFAATEAAMRAVERHDLGYGALPAWLSADAGDEESDGPRFGP